MKTNYSIRFRSGKTLRHCGQIDTTTFYGYVALFVDGREVAIYTVSEIAEIRSAK